jgi:hypothetical protein
MCVIDFIIGFYVFFLFFTAVPSEIKKKLSKGLPAHWRMMVKTWASLLPPEEK